MTNPSASEDAATAAALIGLPVDVRRPGDMSREDYVAGRAGQATMNASQAAGLQQRRAMIIAAAVGVAALGATVLATLFLS